ncbi:MAG: tetratricopeptide repeat protein [Candidatus Omnitrophica bacterium]|nr:tetratricopeptide repeat protein [Candidatus Omnitrophota bacterium]
MKRLTLLFILFFTLISSSAQAFWIWTPKTGKWTNPKAAVKPSPKEQFDFAKGLYTAKEYDDAKREFTKILKIYPKSSEAAESQFYLGQIEEERGDLWGAYQAYQKVIDKYPFSERIADINEREFNIAEKFMSGAKRKALGMTIPVENPAIEIFQKVVSNSQYGPLAAKAQYKLGLVYKSLLQFYEAEEAFNKVVTSYPDSEWVAAAKFQIASCRASLSRGPAYDQVSSKEAKDKFEEFVRANPDAELSKEAEKNIQSLSEKEAESNYDTARFYEKQKNFKSAQIYYNAIIEGNPQSVWAAKSVERLKIMEKLRK